LQSKVAGKVIFKTFLSGMPQMKVGFSNSLERLENVLFHQCITTKEMDLVSFIPPDGEFDFMKYECDRDIINPLNLTPSIHVYNKQHLEIVLQLKCTLPESLCVKGLKISIPIPNQCIDKKISVSSGKYNLKTEGDSIQWKIPNCQGQNSCILKAEMIYNEDIVTPKIPILITFYVSSWSASNFNFSFVKVFEPKQQYRPTKSIRYTTQATFELIP